MDAELLDDKTKKELADNAGTDVPAVKSANLYGGRTTLRLTAAVPAAMAVGFLGLLLYYQSIGGYKVLNVDGTEKTDKDGGH